MKRIPAFSVLVASLLSVQALDYDYTIPDQHVLRLETGPETYPTVWEQFQIHFDDRVDKTFFDRLHPLSTMQWRLGMIGDEQALNDRSAEVFKGALEKTISYSLRESFENSEFMLTMREGPYHTRRWLAYSLSFAASVVADSVGAVEEGEIEPLGDSFSLAEQSWWQNMKRYRRGIRLFRANPYAYLSLPIGSHNRQPLFFLDVRYYLNHFQHNRFTAAITIPLIHKFSFRMGMQYDLFENRENAIRAVLRLQQRLGRHSYWFMGGSPVGNRRVQGGLTWEF